MSKIICDVCGTSYPETATQCPICGCVRSSDSVAVAGDAGDVARAHRCGEGGANCLEGGDGALLGFRFAEDFTDGFAHGYAELANLHKAQAQGEIQAHAHDQDHGGNAPNKTVHGVVQIGDEFQHW